MTPAIVARGPGWELHCADSLLWMFDQPADSVDALITDPPYSSGGQFRGDRTASVIDKYQRSGYAQGEYPEFYGDTRDQRGYLQWCAMWLAQTWRMLKDGGACGVFSDWRMLPTVTDAIQMGGYVWRGIVPWHKPNGRRQMGRFAGSCEYLVWGSKGAMPVERGVGALPGFFQANSVPGEDRQHVTEKPESVLQEIVRIVPPDGLIFDPFGGACTTGIAALLEGRRFLGCELSPEYHKISCDRFAALESLGHRKDAERGQTQLFAAPVTEDKEQGT